MIGKYVQGRTAVFIDAANIHFSQKTLRWRVDYKRLLDYFKKHTNLCYIGFYGAVDPNNKAQNKFHDFLKAHGYVVRTKKIKLVSDWEGRHHKGNIDVELTIDAVHLRDTYDSIVLLSGDGDFAALMVYLRKYRKRCISMSTKKHIARELVDQTKYIDFRKIRNEIMRTNKNPGD